MDNNPQFVYDGKRMRTFTDRKAIDYSSSVIYTKYHPTEKVPSINSFFTPRLAHISLNKVKCTVNCIKYTNCGRRLISGTSTGEFTLWNGYSFNFETILQAHESPIRSLSWAPSGSFLVSGDTLGIIKYWHPSMSNIQLINAHTESVRDLSFAPSDFKFVSASDDGTLKIWDSQKAICENELKGHGWDVRAAKWHPTYSLIASGGKDNTVKLWDPRGSELTTLHIHKNTVFTLKWSQDGQTLLSAGKDQTIKMYNIKSEEIFVYKTNGKDVTALGIHPHVDDFFVAGTSNGALLFYQKFREDPIKVIERAHDNIIWCAEYHPMGNVLTTGSLDQSCRFWLRDPSHVEGAVEKDERIERDETSEEIPGF